MFVVIPTNVVTYVVLLACHAYFSLGIFFSILLTCVSHDTDRPLRRSSYHINNKNNKAFFLQGERLHLTVIRQCYVVFLSFVRPAV